MFGKTLQASFRQLGMMGMVVMTGVIFFSTLVYFLEKDEPNSGFYSIPASCWWCLVTMSTVSFSFLRINLIIIYYFLGWIWRFSTCNCCR